VNAAIIAEILDHGEMPRFQDPAIQLRADCPRPYYYIRPYVPRLTEGGIVRKQEVLRLGWADELTSKKQREAEKQRIMAEINGGKEFLRAQIPLRHAIEKYERARLPQLAASTQEKYANHIKNHILPGLGTLMLCEIAPADLQEWLNGKALASLTKADILNCLSAVIEQAKAWRLFDGQNPCHAVKLGRVEPTRQKYLLTDDQMRKLLDALSSCGAATQDITGPDVALMVEVILASGWRITEVLALQPDAIGEESIEVRRTWYRGNLSQSPKTTAGWRSNIIGKDLCAELRARADVFVFQSATGMPPDDRELVQHILRPCAESVGCYREGFGFRSFRRQNITWRQHAGASAIEASKLAGHTRVDTTAIYTVMDRDREREQVMKILGRVQ
jgi:integrase